MTKRFIPILFVVLLAGCTPKEGAMSEGGGSTQPPTSAGSQSAASAEAEAAAYIRQHMTVKDVRIGEGRQGTDGNEVVRALYGVVSNGGGRALQRVAIHAELLDAGGKPVAAAEFIPVSAVQDGKVNEAHLLKGHTDRSFGYSIEHMIPEGWSGTARVTVTGVEFQG